MNKGPASKWSEVPIGLYESIIEQSFDLTNNLYLTIPHKLTNIFVRLKSSKYQKRFMKYKNDLPLDLFPGDTHKINLKWNMFGKPYRKYDLPDRIFFNSFSKYSQIYYKYYEYTTAPYKRKISDLPFKIEDTEMHYYHFITEKYIYIFNNGFILTSDDV